MIDCSDILHIFRPPDKLLLHLLHLFARLKASVIAVFMCVILGKETNICSDGNMCMVEFCILILMLVLAQFLILLQVF